MASAIAVRRRLHEGSGDTVRSSANESVREIEELYRATYQRLVLSAYALTGDLPEAQDAVREAFVRAVSRPAKVLAADSPEASSKDGVNWSETAKAPRPVAID